VYEVIKELAINVVRQCDEEIHRRFMKGAHDQKLKEDFARRLQGRWVGRGERFLMYSRSRKWMVS